MRRKLKSRRGVTLVEMLVALLILSMLTAGGVAATSAVMADYTHMAEASNADILASTVIEAISNEIRLGRGASVDATDSGVLKLEKSLYFGENVEIKLDTATGHLVAETKDAAGNPVTKQVLSQNAYGTTKDNVDDDPYGGLKLKDLIFEKDSEAAAKGKTVIKITFSVVNEQDVVLWNNAPDSSVTPPDPGNPVSAAPMFD